MSSGHGWGWRFRRPGFPVEVCTKFLCLCWVRERPSPGSSVETPPSSACDRPRLSPTASIQVPACRLVAALRPCPTGLTPCRAGHRLTSEMPEAEVSAVQYLCFGAHARPPCPGEPSAQTETSVPRKPFVRGADGRPAGASAVPQFIANLCFRERLLDSLTCCYFGDVSPLPSAVPCRTHTRPVSLRIF